MIWSTPIVSPAATSPFPAWNHSPPPPSPPGSAPELADHGQWVVLPLLLLGPPIHSSSLLPLPPQTTAEASTVGWTPLELSPSPPHLLPSPPPLTLVHTIPSPPPSPPPPPLTLIHSSQKWMLLGHSLSLLALLPPPRSPGWIRPASHRALYLAGRQGKTCLGPHHSHNRMWIPLALPPLLWSARTHEIACIIFNAWFYFPECLSNIMQYIHAGCMAIHYELEAIFSAY